MTGELSRRREKDDLGVTTSSKSFVSSTAMDTVRAVVFFSLVLTAFLSTFSRYGQDIWLWGVRTFGGDIPAYTFFFGVLPNIWYYVICFLFFLLDLVDWSGAFPFLHKYKTQPASSFNAKLYLEAVCASLRNTLLVEGPVMYTLVKYYFSNTTCLQNSTCHELPSTMTILGHFFVALLCEDFFFYWTHRFFHLGSFCGFPVYATFHKFHHIFKAPFAVTAKSAGVPEHLISNLFPALSGLILVRAHPLTCVLWLFVAITSTCISHSGWNLPFLPSPTMHDLHHELFTVNYGVLGTFDRMFGTLVKERPSAVKTA